VVNSGGEAPRSRASSIKLATTYLLRVDGSLDQFTFHLFRTFVAIGCGEHGFKVGPVLVSVLPGANVIETSDLESDRGETGPPTDAEGVAWATGNYPITEDSFDLVYPDAIRSRSANFWTPVAVARRAAEFLAPTPGARVLDIGSGVGKFCIVGSATTGAWFSGIEHRPHLVAIANGAVRQFQVSRVAFTAGMIGDIDWSCFDAFYLFNPFEENIFADSGALDRSVTLSEDRFWIDAAFVERKLASLPVGVRVATFHGFGGRIPPSYELVAQHPMHGGVLRLWTKVSPHEKIDGGTLEALMLLPDLTAQDADR
jgi:hypothetical protein